LRVLLGCVSISAALVETMKQDELNRSTWTTTSAQRFLEEQRTFPGEVAALQEVKQRLAGRPILDLGVGMGRTIPMLMGLTSDYRALDYLPEMVEACRHRYPSVRVDLGDARSLAQYPDRHFGLVNFAFNGIDSVSNSDRTLVLNSVRRVLAPGGMFFFSTLNLEGPAAQERPWRPRVGPTRNPLRFVARLSGATLKIPVDLMNWVRVRAMTQRGPGYQVAPLSAHNYSILAHYTTLHRQVVELTNAGFASDVLVFDNATGRRIDLIEDKSNVDWFHIVAHPAEN
jgi:SAM-dependent methyltransferase